MRIHMDDSRTLKILDPWTMMYVEYEQEFIEELHREIGPEHPLYRRDVFAIAAILMRLFSKLPTVRFMRLSI
jgi:hypothetical protein